ncbi:hypothetical protein [Pigmentiphaga humi]|uniref:hypothetical protein n=1 Tax=Pigmentiphaga humi TaxID=2478468 RepID=UPI0011CDE6B8|nr:hypothetical protein [Pigmentiphaga humi]
MSIMSQESYDQLPVRSLPLLLRQLPRLDGDARGIDFAGSDAEAMVAVAEAAEGVVLRAHAELESLGTLLAFVEGDATRLSASAALAGIGDLIAELSAFATACVELAADCRYETADYCPLPP